jgi:hypothetical protein
MWYGFQWYTPLMSGRDTHSLPYRAMMRPRQAWAGYAGDCRFWYLAVVCSTQGPSDGDGRGLGFGVVGDLVGFRAAGLRLGVGVLVVLRAAGLRLGVGVLVVLRAAGLRAAGLRAAGLRLGVGVLVILRAAGLRDAGFRAAGLRLGVGVLRVAGLRLGAVDLERGRGVLGMVRVPRLGWESVTVFGGWSGRP